MTIESARARAREQVSGEILAEAARQLAVDGAAGLSLRAVARELGMASSGIYRYFKDRDELLTALIVRAYDALGEVVEAAAAGEGPPRTRWVAACSAVREWALANRHEYALIYGSPVPGYAAPAYTSDSGTRPSLALVSIVADAWAGGTLAAPSRGVPDATQPDLERLAEQIDFEAPLGTLLATLAAWTQLFGFVSFEVFGQLTGFAEDVDALFVAAVELMADAVGLRPLSG